MAERWEAEMREVKLQSMIEELEARVEKLEGEKAQADAKKPGSAGAIVAVLGVIAAVAAIAIGSGGASRKLSRALMLLWKRLPFL